MALNSGLGLSVKSSYSRLPHSDYHLVYGVPWPVFKQTIGRRQANDKIVFNSAIIAFAIGILNTKYPKFFDGPSGSEIIALLQKAG